MPEQRLAKSAPSSEPVQTASTASLPDSFFYINDVPLELTRFLSIDAMTLSPREKNLVNDVHKWASESVQEPTTGNILEYLSHVTRYLGRGDAGMGKLLKLWEYLRINRHIEDLMKQQRALSNG